MNHVSIPALPDDQAHWLMADLLQWHRREAKPEWWQYFARILDYEADDFLDDSETLGHLELDGEVGTVKQSTIWRYRFEPDQEHKFSVGDEPRDPSAERENYLNGAGVPRCGTIVAIDDAASTVDIKRKKNGKAPHPRALIPGQPISTKVLGESLRRVAEAVLDHGIDGAGPYAAARAILGRRAPRITGHESGTPLRRHGEDSVAAACRLAANLVASALAIQGPPGTGKTYTAARVVLDRIRNNQRVAITAFTHSAIRNLIQAILQAADEAGEAVSIVQKISNPDQAYEHDRVQSYDRPTDAVAASRGADVVAGTPWFLSSEDMIAGADLLIVDEAGQLSLANVIAAASCASNVVLVGDPQQLAQPSKGTHPEGAGASALEHVLAGASTVPADIGLLLDESRRLHPDICEFISEQLYDSRLRSHPSCAQQRIAPGPLAEGAGLRIREVAHRGNRTSCLEEVGAVAELVDALIGRDWTDQDGRIQSLELKDVLVVTPYNAQVHALAEQLPSRARIGTVDKFQGQEAPVVIVSMVASSAEDVPRGMEFLYSRNRLNVAVSRAQALSILVASPELLSVQCRTLGQMRLANMLCRYFEVATTIDEPVVS